MSLTGLIFFYPSGGVPHGDRRPESFQSRAGAQAPGPAFARTGGPISR